MYMEFCIASLKCLKCNSVVFFLCLGKHGLIPFSRPCFPPVFTCSLKEAPWLVLRRTIVASHHLGPAFLSLALRNCWEEGAGESSAGFLLSGIGCGFIFVYRQAGRQAVLSFPTLAPISSATPCKIIPLYVPVSYLTRSCEALASQLTICWITCRSVSWTTWLHEVEQDLSVVPVSSLSFRCHKN